MFFVLDTSAKTRKIQLISVPFGENMHYYKITAGLKKGSPNWKKIRKKAEKISPAPPLILTPEAISPPKWAQPSPDFNNMFEAIVLEHIVDKLTCENTKRIIGIIDPENRYIPQTQRLSLAAVSVTVVSSSPEEYLGSFEQFSDRYGTQPIITERTTALKNCDLVIVTGSCFEQLSVKGRLLFSSPKYLSPCQFFSIQLNEAAFPPDIDRLRFLFAAKKHYPDITISVKNIYLT